MISKVQYPWDNFLGYVIQRLNLGERVSFRLGSHQKIEIAGTGCDRWTDQQFTLIAYNSIFHDMTLRF